MKRLVYWYDKATALMLRPISPKSGPFQPIPRNLGTERIAKGAALAHASFAPGGCATLYDEPGTGLPCYVERLHWGKQEADVDIHLKLGRR